MRLLALSILAVSLTACTSTQLPSDKLQPLRDKHDWQGLAAEVEQQVRMPQNIVSAPYEPYLMMGQPRQAVDVSERYINSQPAGYTDSTLMMMPFLYQLAGDDDKALQAFAKLDKHYMDYQQRRTLFRPGMFYLTEPFADKISGVTCDGRVCFGGLGYTALLAKHGNSAQARDLALSSFSEHPDIQEYARGVIEFADPSKDAKAIADARRSMSYYAKYFVPAISRAEEMAKQDSSEQGAKQVDLFLAKALADARAAGFGDLTSELEDRELMARSALGSFDDARMRKAQNEQMEQEISQRRWARVSGELSSLASSAPLLTSASGSSSNSYAYTQVAQQLASVMQHSPSSAATTSATLPSSVAASSSAGVSEFTFSGNCDAAQQSFNQYAEKIGQDYGNGGICQGGKGYKLLGELTIKLADYCKDNPDSANLRQEGQDMVSQAQETISGSCSN